MDKFEKIDKEIKGYTQEHQPGREKDMDPKPIAEDENYKASGKLKGKVALITGGDSGIGRAVAILYAKEGADVAIGYFDEATDANDTIKRLEALGAKVKAYQHDLKSEVDCKQLIDNVINDFGNLNILVNNGGVQFPQDSLLDITADQIQETFATNVFGMMYLSKAALPHLSKGDTIINTSSVTAYRGSKTLIDYSATKGAITAFTRSLSQSLADDGIRVNSVAPGPIYTPLIPATFPAEKVEKHGEETALGRRGQPSENAPAYVYLASNDSTYVTGQTIHINGGDYISS
ncbi:SDR family oxidoreductase [Macrococcoides goetzii]|uniref:SDR family oxidoreductase n=1 Tax=Macrococcus TaxID=69965 RepID=UPI001EF213C5|nr:MULTISPECIES: SDR family oxidoreductase [Macrococcus]MCG7419539.1 SDR family oxidoreductase [Macrococcus epidermidis]MCH4985237.1 SDR family oxidoreductase [Macrococcus sp. PK]